MTRHIGSIWKWGLGPESAKVMNDRFPKSIKSLRQKFPKGLLIQVRFVTGEDTVLEFEGVDGDSLVDKLLASAREAQTKCRYEQKEE